MAVRGYAIGSGSGTTVPGPLGPLAGLRVLDCSSLIAGPTAAMYLGDYGADVVKIEHPQGDGLRVWGAVKDGAGLYFKMLNRNKRAITADLHTPLGVEIVRRLAARADAMIENFRPGTLEKWGLGYDALAARKPGARPDAGDRLRPDRAGARSARLRHHRGGGHRLRGHQRRGRRPAAPAELRRWRTRRPGSPAPS